MNIEKITINGKDYTMSEARELYNEPHLIFGEKTYTPLYPYQPQPFNPLEFPYPVTYEGEAVQTITTGEYFLDPSTPFTWTGRNSN